MQRPNAAPLRLYTTSSEAWAVVASTKHMKTIGFNCAKPVEQENCIQALVCRLLEITTFTSKVTSCLQGFAEQDLGRLLSEGPKL